MDKIEFIKRSLTCEVRAEKTDKTYTIKGLPIVFNSETDLGYMRETITDTALDKTDLRDVRFLVNHDLNKIPLARSRNNNANSTMRLLVNKARGMEIEADLDVENNAEARSLYSAVERGDITGMSFMFGIRGCDWFDLDSDKPLRKITDISQVIEVSAVTLPAYESTEISARDKTALDSAKAALDNARAKANAEANEKRELELLKEKYKYM